MTSGFTAECPLCRYETVVFTSESDEFPACPRGCTPTEFHRTFGTSYTPPIDAVRGSDGHLHDVLRVLVKGTEWHELAMAERRVVDV